MVEENRLARKLCVPWFWRLDRRGPRTMGIYEKECKYDISIMLRLILIKCTFIGSLAQRRARAQRCSEEKEIVAKEMEWVVRTSDMKKFGREGLKKMEEDEKAGS